jgi:eukaryotic-like serine/threonine-protein kinase
MPQPRSVPDVYVGKILSSRYLITDFIGKGGMGRVYLAEDLAKGRMQVAVKILVLSLRNKKISQRFAREIFIGAQLGRKSRNIVRVLSYGMTDDKTPFYVMEYLRGKNLKKIIKIEPLNMKKFLYICYQICLGLQHAHQGISFKGKIYPILHRDIKPENIFISQDPEQGEIVRILDFGISKFLTERTGVTLTDSFVGSLPYSSPEHMEGSKQIDVRSDIYSLGVVMFEMLTGKLPFKIPNNSFGSWYKAHQFETPLSFAEVNPYVKVPINLQQLVLNCLAKNPQERPENVGKILSILKQVQLEVFNTHSANTSKIEPNTSSVQLVPISSEAEKDCWQQTWPKNKPISPIAFPRLLRSSQGVLATFWAMLPQAEINQFIGKNHHTELIAKMNVYPMALLVTMLCNAEYSLIRWLSFFCDMKDDRGYKMVKILADTGYYYLLFFAMEDPTSCSHVMTVNLTTSQRQQMSDFLIQAHHTNNYISSRQAKVFLKAEYKKNKLQILKELPINARKDKKDWKNWDWKNCASHLICNFMQNLSLVVKHSDKQ